eukprot:3121568-Prymnesium_polylepis.1
MNGPGLKPLDILNKLKPSIAVRCAELPEVTAKARAEAEAKTKARALDDFLRKLQGGATELTYDDDCKLRDAGVEELTKVLEGNTTLTYLRLSGNDIGDAGVEKLAKWLERNTTLTYLGLSWNKVSDGGARALAAMLEGNTTLTALRLGENNIGEAGVEKLVEALGRNTTITDFDIDTPILALQKQFAAALERNRRQAAEAGMNTADTEVALRELKQGATKLNLSSKDIGVVGVWTLAAALKANTTLTALNLNDTHKGDEGARA